MEVVVLNTNFEVIALLDVFKSLIWTDRYDQYGDFEIYIPADSNTLKFLNEDHYLFTKDSEHGMIVEQKSIESDVEDGDYVAITGRSLESILTRRIIWGTKVLTGNFQDAIETLLNEAIIAPSDQDRKIENFIFQKSNDPKITELTIDAQYTCSNLYTTIEELCKKNHIGFKVVLNETNQFVFSLYAGVDRSYSQTTNPYVVFSPNFENIANSNYYTSKMNYKNVTLVVGEGEEFEYATTVTVGSASGLDRREMFTDASNTSSDSSEATLTEDEYLALLKEMGDKDLNTNSIKTAFEGEVDATNMFVYGEDFFVGDIVQIANEYGHEGTVYISELVLSQGEDGTSVYPTFKTVQEEEEDSE